MRRAGTSAGCVREAVGDPRSSGRIVCPSVVPKIRILSPGVQKSRLTHRVEIFVSFMSAQRWVLGGNSTKLAHLVNTR